MLLGLALGVPKAGLGLAISEGAPLRQCCCTSRNFVGIVAKGHFAVRDRPIHGPVAGYLLRCLFVHILNQSKHKTMTNNDINLPAIVHSSCLNSLLPTADGSAREEARNLRGGHWHARMRQRREREQPNCQRIA